MWLFGGKSGTKAQRAAKPPVNKAVERIEHVLSLLRLTVVTADEEMRFVALPLRHTYQVKLYAWPEKESRVCLVASFDYRVDREFILRELALELLEENHALQDEAFTLIPRADHDRLIGCRRVISLENSSNAELILACTSLIERMQRMVARLYAKGLIPSGPSTITD